MSEIEIDIDGVFEAAKIAICAEKHISGVKEKLKIVSGRIDQKVKNKNDIGNRLNNAVKQLNEIEHELAHITDTIRFAANQYRQTDDKIRSQASSMPEVKDHTAANVTLSVGVSATVTVGAATSTKSNTSTSYTGSSSYSSGASSYSSSSSAPASFSTVHREEDEVWIDVPLAGQHTDYTCGSASGCMILSALGVSCSEEAYWRYANSNGQGTYVYRVAQALNHFLGSNKYDFVATNNMSLEEYYQTILKSLENGYPVEVVMSVEGKSEFGYSTEGHYVVVTGVYKNEDGEYIAKINDPFSKNWYNNGHQGQQIEMRLSDLHRYNKKHSSYIICNT